MNEITSAALIALATDLTASLGASARYDRLLDTVRKTIPCEAVALLSYSGAVLKPLAQQGLSRDTLGRRFALSEHPRFAEICSSRTAVRFPADCDLPDPYDGLLIDREGDLPVHACMGLPLYFDDQLIGILTLDSLNAGVFDDIPNRTLEVVSALAAAALNTALLLECLESVANHSKELVSELTEEALQRDGGELIGQSEQMLKLQREIKIAAPSDFTVLICGETGVGKELVARMIHRESTRSAGPMVYVNCAALPENLIESELFGHVRGAFTGAEKKRAGKFALADGGSLFLDEVGELPLAAQSKLLRALQNREIQPVGQDSVQRVDVRVIAATNRDLAQEVHRGAFRADLFHRLSVYPVQVPSLRDRTGDVLLLSGYFVEQVRRKLGVVQLKLSAALMRAFETYHWPGNVRELEHLIGRSALKARSRDGAREIVSIELGDCTELASVVPSVPAAVSEPLSRRDIQSLRHATDDFQRGLICEAIARNDGNWAAAARELEVDRANFGRTAKRLGVRQIKLTQR
ncbi:MAG: nitric oxide reductase transcriptional regulator NorR [Pseudomonadales bacterium]